MLETNEELINKDKDIKHSKTKEKNTFKYDNIINDCKNYDDTIEENSANNKSSDSEFEISEYLSNKKLNKKINNNKCVSEN
jgi:hypothetical protein